MTNYVEELLVEALIGAPGCPEPLVERMLRSAMVDFYRASQAWRFTSDNTPVIKGIREVELELPAGTYAGRVFWVRLDGRDLRAVSTRSLATTTGVPRGYALDGVTRTLQLDVLPQENYLRNGLVANVAVLPMAELDTLPDELYAFHRDGILYGALTKLLAMPNVAWGDMQGAATYAGMAAVIQNEARREANSLQAPVARKVRYGGI